MTLQTARKQLEQGETLTMRRLYRQGQRYQMQEARTFELSNGQEILIPHGFEYDLSSSPRILWAMFPPDGDFQIAALIHDFLYINKPYSRRFADREMLKWSRAVNGTRKISIRNFDNWARYVAVRLFGWIIWHRKRRKA